MKKIKTYFWVFVVLGLLASPSRVQAEQEEDDNSSRDIQLVYYLEQEQFLSLTLAVKGDGAVLDGEQEIRNGINMYDLLPNQEKKFIVQPDPGNKISMVTMNEQEISGINQDTIVVKGLREDSQIKVLFEQEEEKTESSLDVISTNTGEKHSIWWIQCLFILSSIILLALLWKRKGIRKERK